MQTKTILALFCTIVVLFIGGNDGAPTTTQKAVLLKPEVQNPALLKPEVQKPALLKPETKPALLKPEAKPALLKPEVQNPALLKPEVQKPALLKPETKPALPKPETKPVLSKPESPTSVGQSSTIKPGGRTQWKTTINKKSKKLFNDYKKIISKKLQTTHKVPATFDPKPEKTATQLVSGTLHHYLVKVPANKYAYVTIHHQAWKKGEYGKEAHVTVRPQLYELNDKNI